MGDSGIIKRIISYLWFDFTHPSPYLARIYVQFFKDKLVSKISSVPDLSSEAFHWRRFFRQFHIEHPDCTYSALGAQAKASIIFALERLRKEVQGDICCLDVGSGPTSQFHTRDIKDDERLKVIVVDPLAEVYRELHERYKTGYDIECVEGYGEELHKLFQEERFHLVYTQNAMDHSQNPVEFFKSCYDVVSDGGYLIVHGFIKEGTAARWIGLHNWDIEVDGDDLLLTDKKKKYNRFNITRDYGLEPVYKIITGENIGDMYTFIYRKTAEATAVPTNPTEASMNMKQESTQPEHLHICYVTRNYDAPHMGGRNPSLRYIEKHLRNLGHDVTIISTSSSREALERPWPPNVHFTKFSFSYYTNLFFATWRIYNLMRTIHRRKRIDIVHSCEREFAGLAAYLFRKRFSVPFVQWAYDQGYATQKRNILDTKSGPLVYPALFYMWLSERFVLRKADMIATIGEDINESLLQRGFDEGRIRFIGNAVDTGKYRPGLHSEALEKELGLQAKKVISCIGRVNKIRGTDVFIRAAGIVNQHVEECVFLIVGNDRDDFKKECLKIEEDLGVKNILWIPERDDVPQILNLSHCVVIPVRKIGAGIGNALLEAMSCGKPVVQSRVAGAPYVINNWENGVLVPDGDYEETAQAIVKLCESINLGEKLGEQARQTVVNEYNVERISKKLLHCYRELLTRND